MTLNWQTNYWEKEVPETWRVYLKTDLRNILVSIFDEYKKAMNYMINNEKEIYKNYKHIGKLYMVEPAGNYNYEYRGASLLADLPPALKGKSLFTFYCPQTKVTFISDRDGHIEHSFQGNEK